jgi:DNA-binding response OmpR family regulator
VRVLVAEDHEKLAQTVAVGLRREGMAVDIALDGQLTAAGAIEDRVDGLGLGADD